MCLAIPARIVSVEPGGQIGQADVGGVSKEVSLALLDEVAIGDYVLIHVGCALSRIDEDEAKRTLYLIEEVARMHETAQVPQ